jgi:hypothetical protein
VIAACAASCWGCSLPDSVLSGTPASDPMPTAVQLQAVHRQIKTAYATFKLPGEPEISPLHPNASPYLANWSICLRNNAPEDVRYYTFFVKSDSVIGSRLSVQVDRCEQQTFAPLVTQ